MHVHMHVHMQCTGAGSAVLSQPVAPDAPARFRWIMLSRPAWSGPPHDRSSRFVLTSRPPDLTALVLTAPALPPFGPLQLSRVRSWPQASPAATGARRDAHTLRRRPRRGGVTRSSVPGSGGAALAPVPRAASAQHAAQSVARQACDPGRQCTRDVNHGRASSSRPFPHAGRSGAARTAAWRPRPRPQLLVCSSAMCSDTHAHPRRVRFQVPGVADFCFTHPRVPNAVRLGWN